MTCSPLLSQGDRDQASEEADELHRLILRVGGTRRIESIVRHQVEFTTYLHQVALATPGRLEKSIKEHQNVAAALYERSPEKAERRMRQHISSAEDDVLAVYQNFQQDF